MARSIYAVMAKERPFLSTVNNENNVVELPVKQTFINKPKNLTVDNLFLILEIQDLIGNNQKLKDYFYKQITVTDNLLELIQEIKYFLTIDDHCENIAGLFSSDIDYVEVNKILIDPKKFQFKIICDKNGSTGSLKSVKNWNNELSGLILVWIDPSNNQIYCVNGHNRLSLAKSLNVKTVAVRYIEASDHIEARLKGAIANIAEGNGTILDAAKLIKDSNLSLLDLRNYGLNITKDHCNKALHLSKLSDHLFEKVLIGDIPLNYGIYAGHLDQSLQDTFIQLCLKKDSQGNIKDNILLELGDQVSYSKNSTKQVNTLFGVTTLLQNNAIEKSILIDYCLTELKKDKSLFSMVSNAKNVNKLASNNNIIDYVNNEAIANQSKIFIDLFNQFKNVSGRISSVLNDYAYQLNDSKNQTKLKQECYDTIKEVLELEYNTLSKKI